MLKDLKFPVSKAALNVRLPGTKLDKTEGCESNVKQNSFNVRSLYIYFCDVTNYFFSKCVVKDLTLPVAKAELNVRSSSSSFQITGLSSSLES